jgi:hypothetical protein
VNEGVLKPQEMMVVIFVQFAIELQTKALALGEVRELEMQSRAEQLTRSKTDTSIIL